MVEVKVIIVTHGNPRPTGRETAPQGDSGEKGLACSASTGYALALAVTETDAHTHTYVSVRTRAHRDAAWHTEGPPGLSLIDLEQFY